MLAYLSRMYYARMVLPTPFFVKARGQTQPAAAPMARRMRVGASYSSVLHHNVCVLDSSMLT